MTHRELVDRGVRWLRQKGCRIVLAEFTAMTVEIPDVIGWRGGNQASYLLEAKASRSDYLADRNKPFRVSPELGVGQYRYFICEPNVIRVEDLPERWGLLYVKEKTVSIECGQDPARIDWPEQPWQFQKFNHTAERTLLLSALVRLQLHHGQREMHDLVHESYASKQAKSIAKYQEQPNV